MESLPNIDDRIVLIKTLINPDSDTIPEEDLEIGSIGIVEWISDFCVIDGNQQISVLWLNENRHLMLLHPLDKDCWESVS